MLRMTIKSKTAQTIHLALDGKVVGLQVQLLEQEGQRHMEASQRLVLDLDGVQFIDEEGLALLRRWAGARLELRGGSAFLKALLAAEGLNSN